MGQQQMLLLVLSIVIVSIAVYAGINIFNTSMRQRHADLLMNHAVHAASEAVVWYSKASPFLGGSGSYADLSDEGMAQLFMSQGRPPGIRGRVGAHAAGHRQDHGRHQEHPGNHSREQYV